MRGDAGPRGGDHRAARCAGDRRCRRRRALRRGAGQPRPEDQQGWRLRPPRTERYRRLATVPGPRRPAKRVNASRATQTAGEGEVDLAARLLGGTVVAASDESFGEKEHLLNVGPASFEPGRYGPHGEIVDGWETRRRREPGYDWVVVRLGLSGRISTVDVDTTSFTGNFPPECAI